MYEARVGLFDVDYVGHLNNAATLSHCEFARWQMAAETGLLQTFLSKNVHIYALDNVVRYRKEIRPLFRSFVIETYVLAVDHRNLWFLHNFRLDEKNRINTQVLMRSALLKKGSIIPPREFLVDDCHFDNELVQAITLPDGELVSEPQLLDSFNALGDSMRNLAAEDDARFK